MRIISQDGRIDAPYERCVIWCYKDQYLDVCHVTCDCGDEAYRRLADYSTEAKAVKTMEMLRKAYENNEFYHHTSATDAFKDVASLLSNEEFNKLTSEYFQFPQDDEIEV